MLFVCYPKCSTCKKAKDWLETQGVSFTERDIKTDNPTEAELREWHRRSGLPLKRFFNTSGLQYKALGLKDRLPGMTEDERAEVEAQEADDAAEDAPEQEQEEEIEEEPIQLRGETKICPVCKAEVDGDALFCNHCGAQL